MSEPGDPNPNEDDTAARRVLEELLGPATEVRLVEPHTQPNQDDLADEDPAAGARAMFIAIWLGAGFYLALALGVAWYFGGWTASVSIGIALAAAVALVFTVVAAFRLFESHRT